MNIKLLFLLSICFRVTAQEETRILDYYTHISIVNNELVKEEYIHIFIKEKKDISLASISEVIKKDDSFKLLEAKIYYKSGKKVKNYSNNDIKSRRFYESGSFYDDLIVKELNTTSAELPFEVILKFRTTQKNWMNLATWYPCRIFGITVNKATLHALLPSNFSFKIKSNYPYNYHSDTIINNVNHFWSVSNLKYSKIIEKNSFSPANTLPRIEIIPVNFHYGIDGSFDSWESFGLWNHLLIKDLDELSNAEKKIIDSLVYGSTDKKQIIHILNKYRQNNTRYIYTELGIGGFKPYSAQYVGRNKFGDCKALTIYMKAMLKHVGITSFYTLIKSGELISDFDAAVPSQQFDHVILCVPLLGDTMWIENTSSYLPAGYLGMFTQGRDALIINNENSRLVKTPSLQHKDVVFSKEISIKLDKNGNGQCESKFNLKGPSFEKYYYYFNELPSIDVRDFIINEHPFPKAELDTFYYKVESPLVAEIEVKSRLKLYNQFRKIGELNLIKENFTPYINVVAPSLRKTAFKIDYPMNINEVKEIQIIGIENSKISIPSNKVINYDFGTYQESYIIKGESIIIYSSFKLNAGDYYQESYIDLYEFIENIKKYKSNNRLIIDAK